MPSRPTWSRTSRRPPDSRGKSAMRWSSTACSRKGRNRVSERKRVADHLSNLASIIGRARVKVRDEKFLRAEVEEELDLAADAMRKLREALVPDPPDAAPESCPTC